MTDAQIAAELGRIEREMREAATKGQIACEEAMNIIEKMMADLGAPMAKRPAAEDISAKILERFEVPNV